MGPNFVVGLDIGTASVKAVVAENEGGHPVPRLIFKQPSEGIRKGVIVDLAEAAQTVGHALAEVRKLSKAAARNVYLTIGTSQVKTQPSKGIVAVSRSDNEIYSDDVTRVMKASQAVNLGPNRMVIHHVNREFIVDGVSDISDPLGLSGSRLEVNSLIIDAFAPHIKNLIRVVELGGGQIGGMVFAPLAASRSALSKRQKELGVALIDIGAGTTGLSVYEEGKLVGAAKFPVGSGHITNDLAVGLKIPVAAAEEVKLKHGYALAKEVGGKDIIELQKFAEEARGTVSRRFVAEIIESRLAEIFELIYNELKSFGKAGELPGGAVFVGGGAKLSGLAELAKQELKLSSRTAALSSAEWTAKNENFDEYIEDPEFASALGLVLWGVDEEHWRPSTFSGGFSIRNAMKYFLP